MMPIPSGVFARQTGTEKKGSSGGGLADQGMEMGYDYSRNPT